MAKRKVATGALTRSAEPLYQGIRAVLESARKGAYRAVNAAMVQAYCLSRAETQNGTHRVPNLTGPRSGTHRVPSLRLTKQRR